MVQEELVAWLCGRQYHISTAESCTAGLVAAGIVNVPGASDVFEEGYITYSDRVKKKLLGVSGETLERYTAVSSQTAREMAAGAAKAAETEVAVSVTGYAGPDDGADGTAAGTVYVGVYFQGWTETKKFLFSGGRQQVREQAAAGAVRYVLEVCRRKEQELG
ncbi:MAG: CinA family protein [Clostridiaceae bacterium]|nr:CinA family protein [Clostridiaceae bacterium]